MAVSASRNSSPLMRLLDWAVLSHLKAIDDEYLEEGKTSDGRILTVVYVSCLVLWVLNYLVLDAGIQRKVSIFVIEAFGLWSGDARTVLPTEMALTSRATWSLGCIFFYLAVPLVITPLVLKRPLSTLGLSPKGFFKHLWIYALLFLPVAACVWIVSYQESFLRTYPFYRNPASMYHLLCWELFYGLQFFALEVFFRGFMLTELKHRWGWRAVLFMVVPYCMIHFTKPGLEAMGAVIAGSVLGVLALRTRNIWGGVAIHVTVAWSMDFASLLQKGWFGR